MKKVFQKNQIAITALAIMIASCRISEFYRAKYIL